MDDVRREMPNGCIDAQPVADYRIAFRPVPIKLPVLRGSRAAAPRAGRVMMIGLRGIPNVQGGVEKHVECLARELVRQGWGVEVVARSRYVAGVAPFLWHGVNVESRWSPASSTLEAIVHTGRAVLHAARSRPDILHIHAIGPALFAPLARALGLKVVVTHHGFDYERQKWGGVAKTMLRLGEFLGMRSANGRIAVSANIAGRMEKHHGLPVSVIRNAVTVEPGEGCDSDILARFGLTPRGYVITVGRVVPEKRQIDLISAFARLPASDMKLVVVGGADHESAYDRTMRAQAAAVPNVVLTGRQIEGDLACLYRNARLFVLPSSHEGMPIAALEAMAFGLPVLLSDIPANLELALEPSDYFPLFDIEALAEAMTRKLAAPFDEDEASDRRALVERQFGWRQNCEATLQVYESVLGRG